MVVAVYRDNRNPSLLQLPNGSVFLKYYLVFAAAEPSWLATLKTIDPKKTEQDISKKQVHYPPSWPLQSSELANSINVLHLETEREGSNSTEPSFRLHNNEKQVSLLLANPFCVLPLGLFEGRSYEGFPATSE